MNPFKEQGYHLFPQIFSPQEMALASTAIAELCLSDYHQDSRGTKNIILLSQLKTHRNPHLTGQEDLNVPFIIGELPAFSQVFRALILQDTLWAIAQKILGSDEIVYHFSNITRKPAGVGPNISWHRDYPNQYICPKASKHFCRILIPLADMNPENGGTEILPQSHLLSDQAAQEEEAKKNIAPLNALPLIAQSGDAIALHPKLLHGGKENRSQHDRNLLVIQFGVKVASYLSWQEELFTGLTREDIHTGF